VVLFWSEDTQDRKDYIARAFQQGIAVRSGGSVLESDTQDRKDYIARAFQQGIALSVSSSELGIELGIELVVSS